MPEATVKRTLVKSPPELWAEISDVASLARRLEEFGEIRITRSEPETTVAWEGDRARGTVELEVSGWGTKVTLTAEPTTAVVAPEPEVVPEPEATQEPEVVPEPEVIPEPEVVPEPVTVHEPEPEPAPEPEPVAVAPVPAPAPAPRRPGFFARLFGRRAVEAPVAVVPVVPVAPAVPPVVAEASAEPEPEPAAPTPTLEPAPAPVIPLPVPEPVAPEADEPLPAAQTAPEPLDEERTTAILAAVLDDLGSAHHRPFSRS